MRRVLVQGAQHLPEPTELALEKILVRVEQRIGAWCRRRGLGRDAESDDGASDPRAESALDACAGIAMQRGTRVTIPSEREGAVSDEMLDPQDDTQARHARRSSGAVERSGFNLHAAVRIPAGDDLGRERLCRYGSRPALSLTRLRRLPGARVAYRIKYVGRGRAKHRVMTGIELCARLAALIPPPRYPLVRYHGVLAPRSSWRKDIVPRPRIPVTGGGCARSQTERPASPSPAKAKPLTRSSHSMPRHGVVTRTEKTETLICIQPALAVTTHTLAPNAVSTTHWDRLLGGALYAATVRIDWATLLRRTFAVDVLECRVCAGRLRVLGAVVDPASARALLERFGLPTDTLQVARARDPTDDGDHDDGYVAPTDDDEDVQ